ncbi:hypothetical protein C1708_00060 [Streptomyces sp. DH-12]|nr:hypothetical protein C1708_00060 [Streptomyces sp. DH-12]
MTRSGRGSSRYVRTGTQWAHPPEKCGNWRDAYNRLRMRAVDGTWERVFTARPASGGTPPALHCRWRTGQS